jgi:protein-S-isoprenylcysteine O-methyltransferase Ste14
LIPPSKESDTPPSSVPWPPLLFIAVIVAGRLLQHFFPAPLIPPELGHVAGALLVSLGVANDIWCALTLRKHRTTILPHRPVSALVTSGPFRYSRNPIYIAELALTLGLGLLLRSPWMILLIPLLFFALVKLAIEPEERHLEQKFGAEFQQYAARTPRWL